MLQVPKAMAEVVILGSGSGFATNDRFCTSIALLMEPHIYLFDCGEPCAALLYRAGIDPLALRTLFISHMHPDHVGGLAPLLFSIYLPGRHSANKFKPWSINRNDPWYRSALPFPADISRIASEARHGVGIVMPSEAIAAIRTYLSAVYLDPSVLPFDLGFTPVVEGTTYHDDLISVSAVANDHLKVNPAYRELIQRLPSAHLQSYSYRIDSDHGTLVFSGDIDRLTELAPLLHGDVDTLIVEVAHYDPKEIRDFVADFSVRRVVLTHVHPGLEDRLSRLVATWADDRFVIARDGLRFKLGTRDNGP